MATRQHIEGKIAAIVTESAVVINRGRAHGVTDGMKFGVFIFLGPIQDPDNPENVLDNLKFRKGIIKVTEVYEKMSYCQIEGRVVPHTSSILRSLSLMPTVAESTVEYPEVVNPLIKSEAWKIRVGDVVSEMPAATKSAESAARG